MDEVSARSPFSRWLNGGLTRKLTVVIVTGAVLAWLLSCGWFLNYLRAYAWTTYDDAMDDASNHAEQVAAFLLGSGGDFTDLPGYLEDWELGCFVEDGEQNILFHFFPGDRTEPRLSAVGGQAVTLPSGETWYIHIWKVTSRQEIADDLRTSAFFALALFNVCVFAVAGILLYLIILAPIIGLRKTMAEYSEHGTLPAHSPRIDEVGKLQNSFADLTGVLHAKDQSERRLIASISHDIKTPLTSILGYSERLLYAKLDEEKQQQYLSSIHDKGLAIKSIVDEFDDYLESGLRDSAPMELLSAQQLCDNLCREYEDELTDAGVKWTVRCTCPQAKLICSPAHMRRYFGNLIANSINHSGNNHLVLELLCRQEGDRLILEFSDNGNGVSPDLLQKIFEPLYTSDRGRKVSGLGLSICQSIIRAHGGSISASNCPSGGLMIRASLPCAKA
jgi:signal transduction histidine kinase